MTKKERLTRALEIAEYVNRTWNDVYGDDLDILMEFKGCGPKFSNAVNRLKMNESKRQRDEERRGFVYLFYCEGEYKIGRTKNVMRRLEEVRKLREIELGKRVSITFVYAIDIEDSVGNEKKAHKHYSDKRIRGEWFDLSSEDVDNFPSIFD